MGRYIVARLIQSIPVLILGATMHLYLPKVGLRLSVTFGLLLIAGGMLMAIWLLLTRTQEP